MSATPKKEAHPTRRREPPLKVYCLPAERSAIEANAQQSGKTVSSFLRLVGTGMTVHSAVDQKAVRELARINADLGRLGGLLKALLTNDERLDGYTGMQLQELTEGTIREILATQAMLQECVRKIL